MTATTRSIVNQLFDDELPDGLESEVSRLECWADAPKNSAARAMGQEAVWSIVERWAIRISEQDIGQTDPSWVGRWTVSESAARIVNSGLFDRRFNLDEFDGDGLFQFVDRAFEERDCPAKILTFLDALRVEFREVIDMSKQADPAEESVDDSQFELEQAQMALESKKSEIESILSDQPEPELLLANQGKLNLILSEVARVAGLARQRGVSPKERRVHMKVTETSRRLSQANFMAIETYAVRKRYEVLQKELIETSMTIQELEVRQRPAPQGVTGRFGLTAEACEEAARAAVGRLRKVMGRLARVPGDAAPPFVLEHAPRLAPMMVAEKVAAVFRAAPRLQNLIEESPLEVWVLPGVGNPSYDAKSGRVWTALFPIEVKLHTILALVGEALFRKEPRLIKGYQQAKKLDSSPSKVWELFRRDFVAWVESDSLGRRTLDTATSEWFETTLSR